ncbi:acetoacetate--CoA ligase [Streptomyces sp. NPDC046716]|uniref:acetoacetate--CoA ligase n=1 Tax=Streptomyces sp. NPDC046716 TaxID=3157093 RepID=UPI0033FB7147
MSAPDPARTAAVRVDPVWVPAREAVEASRLAAFTAHAARRTSAAPHDPYDYAALHAWSVSDLAGFWSAVWEFFEVRSATPYTAVLEGAMPDTRWFPGARLNYAEHALRHPGGGDPALIVDGEDGTVREVSWDALRRQVAALGAWLRQRGVRPGDRVAGYLPHTEHAVIAFLAAASVGAVWSVCAPDYGAAGAASRLGQLEPVVLFTTDGYHWNGRHHDRRAESEQLRAALPSVRDTVRVPGPDTAPGAPSRDADTGSVRTWAEVTSSAAPAEPIYEQLPFDAPLWILFSSGTTGVPKGIVHGHGGVLLDHLKVLGLHMDLRPGERFCWYTTPNWMMWNLLVSGLLHGATLVLCDGAPSSPGPDRLWEVAARHRVSVLGTSPGYLLACEKAGVEPGRDFALDALRVVGSTGAPLPASAYAWTRDHVGPRIQLASTSGGTDVVSGFAGSAPALPVWPGEISAPLLGVDLQAWDADGRAVTDDVGELVVTRPMPSMPLRFWNDPDGERYRAAYFTPWPDVWRHGDWTTVTARGSVVVSGRSDSTLNRHGVRLGSADVYAVVDEIPYVSESLVIGAELPDGGYWMPLFVVTAPGTTLTDAHREEIRTALRTHASPRHVPDDVIEVPALPHTRTGKKLEVPVKRILQGGDPARVAGREAVDDFAALAYFARFAPGAVGRAPRPATAPVHP